MQVLENLEDQGLCPDHDKEKELSLLFLSFLLALFRHRLPREHGQKLCLQILNSTGCWEQLQGSGEDSHTYTAF
jgi:hypothetical protein